VPTPLPNIGRSGISPEGFSQTVKIEGQPVAIRGASFGSIGDIASKGTGGGIVSNNVEGPTKFIAPGSLNVQIEGKNVHLLGDQMLNNCGPGGSPPNAATMAGAMHHALIANFEKYLCKAINECEKEVNEEKFGKGNKPTKEWCRAQGRTPGKTNTMEIGEEKAKCAENKINSVKARSSTDFSKLVQTEKYVPVPGGGWCKPDVMVGSPSDCHAVYDFKTSCPLTSESKPDWPRYGSRRGQRTPPNPNYEGRTQNVIYRDACGVEPKIIHPNSETCKQ
jgi:uncharacterized Zn-binding protein involved in type VI secretion